MEHRYISYYSNHLNRHIDLHTYGHWGVPILMFPTSMGSSTQNYDSGLIPAAKDFIQNGRVKIYCVGSIDHDSFYAKHLDPEQRIYNYSLYVEFLLTELIPFIQHECHTHRIGVGGCSFGAYHSANLAFRFPDLFSFLIAMSGSYNIKNFMDGAYNDLVYHNNPVDFLPNAETWRFGHLKIVLGTSDWDICKEATVGLSQLLGNKGIEHIYDEKKWIGHDWNLWNMVFPEYLSKVL